MCKMVNIQTWIAANPDEATKQAVLFATSNSKRMINFMKVDDEEALYDGINELMTALQQEAEEDNPVPTVTKMHAPSNWEEIAK